MPNQSKHTETPLKTNNEDSTEESLFIMEGSVLGAIYNMLQELPCKTAMPLLETIAETPSLKEYNEKKVTPNIFIPH